MSEFREMPMRLINLSEKKQFDCAKFYILIDKMEDEWFAKSGTDRETLKNLFFDIFSDNPDKEFSWILDAVFNLITEKMSYAEQKQNFLGLATLRTRLAGDSKDNFASSEYIFRGQPGSSGEKPPEKSIEAGLAALGAVDNLLITDKEVHPLDYIDSPATALAKARESTKDEPIN